MGSFARLQNRTLPWSPTSRVIYSWPLDVPEEFCTADDVFTDTADRVIVLGTARCALHTLAERPCPTSFRTPPECPHERLDPAADPGRPRCVTCGEFGSDVSNRWLHSSMFRDPRAAPSEVIGDEVVMLGQPEPEES